MTLENHGVVVDIPFESIKEANPEFKLGLLYVYPFFGYTRGDTTPGYMFIPDGCGSLIRFATTTKATNMFYSRYYGNDLGMLTELPYDITVNRPLKISIPVFGMVHGEKENAYLSIVEKGASYGDLHAHPAGIITNFNFMYSAFIYNESYFQATNRSGAGVTTLQKTTNAFDIKIHYRFLTQNESDYVGMARSYQQYLIEKGVLSKIEEESKDIGIRLEFLGGEKEKVLFWNRLIAMTTVEQMAEIVHDLKISNPEVVYYGWQPLGASTMPPKSLKLDSDLGDIDQLRRLITDIDVDNGNFYLYYDPQAALYNESGYSPRYDLAMSITNANLFGYNRYTVNYYLNYPALSDHFTQLSGDIFSKLNAGLAVDNMGSMLYSDFKPANLLNREQTIQKYQALMDQNEVRTAFYLPNDYFFKYSAAYYDMPLSNNGYIYMTESVPFIQIALSGYIPYYGKALNFSSNMTEDLLRHADYGVYPSYFLTHPGTDERMRYIDALLQTTYPGKGKQNIIGNLRRMQTILLLNEADQFLSARSAGIGSSADQMHNQMQNIFLEQIEKFQGILIATTNLLENIDQAFSRRFNYKIEFKKPDQKQRLALWKMMLPKNAPYEEGFDVEALVSYPLTGGQINLIVKNTAYHVAARKEGIFRLEDFVAEIKKERSGSFEGEKSMGFINR